MAIPCRLNQQTSRGGKRKHAELSISCDSLYRLTIYLQQVFLGIKR
jgi:hypothetical protein